MPQRTEPPYKALREAAGLTQREVERRCGWATEDGKGHGKLSWIERGVIPTDEEHAALMRVLGEALLPKDAA